MSDFSLVGGGSEALNAGYDYSATKGTTITANASADTLGSYTELLSAANNTSPSNKLIVSIVHKGGGTSSWHLINIAIGGSGSEVVIIPNLLCRQTATINGTNSCRYEFPIHIPSGVRISANMQSSTGGVTQDVTIIPCGGSLAQDSGLSSVLSIGANTGTSGGTQVATNATINTFGSWVEITSSTSEAIKGFLVAALRANNSYTEQAITYQVGIGSAGNEEIIFSGHEINQAATEESINTVSGFIAVGVPQGTRIAIRAQTNVSNTDADLDYIIYGVR